MDLLTEVTEGLRVRKGAWKQISEDLKPDVSYSMIARLGRGKYDSSPTLKKLEKIALYLRTHPIGHRDVAPSMPLRRVSDRMRLS